MKPLTLDYGLAWHEEERHMRPNSLDYGFIPSFAEFSAHLNTAIRDDEPVWNEAGYPMELVGTAVEQAELALRRCNGNPVFRVVGFAGQYGKFGLRFADKLSLWLFIKALPALTDDPDGDLASSIMETLGYEWI